MKWIILAGTALCLCSCVTTRTATLQKNGNKGVDVFMTTKPAREYTELKYITAEGSIYNTNHKLMQKLQRRALKEGADAIINVQFGHIVLAPYAAAVAIKYK